MTDPVSATGRIARNTIYLYVRTLISMIVSLYTSRVLLDALGIVDYGVLNVVGGVIVMMSFLNGSMSVATQRYLTYELGRDAGGRFNQVFSMAVRIHFIIGLIALVAGETVGLWFVNTKLVIPADRMFAANCVYQASVMGAVLGIIQTPWNASIVSHERMYIYAWIGLAETFVKLGAVILISRFSGDRLALWALILFAVQFAVAMFYRGYCRRSLPGCRYRGDVWDKELFRQMIGFTGWNMFGTAAWTLKDQGSSILLNIFGGPVVNAARGVAGQVSGAARGLIGGFQTAVNPQLTKNYAGGRNDLTCRLMCQSSKISFYLMLVVSLPLISQIDFILGLWLVDVPAYASLFTILVVMESLFDTLAGPMITSLLATGRIKWYQVTVGTILLLNIPCSYLWLRAGGAIWTPMAVSIAFMMLGNMTRLFFCRSMLGLSLRVYFRDVVIPVAAVFSTGTAVMLMVNHLLPSGWERLIVSVIASLTAVGAMVYTFGLKRGEREALNGMIRVRIAASRTS